MKTVLCGVALTSMLLAPHTSWSQDVLKESPVPVTVITDTMIVNIGAMSLKDVLVTYVPGMTFSQDHNEMNVAMRGVFASSQQKILILVDGHVINSRALDSAPPDFGIGIDRIKRIEVLRGPASVAYGNGALAAVVLIFTKTADDVDGTVVQAGVGNWSQRKFSGVFGGKTGSGNELLAWGTIYRSEGQVVEIPAAQDYSKNPSNAHAILNGFSGPASHDVGLNLKTSQFTLRAAHRLGKYTEPFSAGGPTGESYNYADYQKDNGFGPGQAIRALNLDVSRERALRSGTKLLVRGYMDRNDLIAHLVTDPSAKAHSSVRFSEWDAGFIAELSGSFSTSFTAKPGQWLAGAQADVMRVFDGVLMTGSGGGWTTVGPSGGLVDLGTEKLYSGYVEFQQPLGDKVVAHAGLRFDQKIRLEGANINRASPRLAVVFVPVERATVAVSYSESFIDAPYWYRYNSLPSYRGSRNLQPEFLKSFQITPAITLANGVTVKSNVFFNRLNDLIWRNKNAGPSDPNYQNAGFLRNWGFEPEVGYATDAFNISGNLTYQRATSFEKYDVTGGDVHNIPNWTGNAILNVRVPAVAGQDAWFNVTARCIGPQLSPVNLTIGTTVFNEPDRKVEGAFLTNAGLRVGNIGAGRWFVDARIYNLFDADYEQGGSVSHPYPQPGRSAMLNVGFKL